MPGPPRKSAAEKQLAGNPGNRPINTAEPTPTSGAPPKPKHFDELASETWDWLCDELDALGTLATSDVAAIAMYCDTWGEYVTTKEAIKDQSRAGTMNGMLAESDNGKHYIHPLMQLLSMCRKSLLACNKELGLSPTSRPGIRATKPPNAGNDKGKFFKVPLRVVS